MSLSILLVLAAVALFLHGLVHLLGPAVYLKWTEIEGFAYKTTVLSGRWDLGDSAIRLFGLLWVIPAIGFIIAVSRSSRGGSGGDRFSSASHSSRCSSLSWTGALPMLVPSSTPSSC